MSVEKDRARYEAAMHAMQSGVAMEISAGVSTDTTPKHLRVGVNSCLVDSSALACLLIGKGAISEAEYVSALALSAEREKASYEDRLSRLFNKTVRLG